MSELLADEIDLANKFLVGARGKQVVILNPPTRLTELSPDEALLLAAWLVAIAEYQASTPFAAVLEKVQNT